MNLNTIVIAFFGCLGGLLGGVHGALLALTIVLGISLVVTTILNIVVYNRTQAELKKLKQTAEEAQWAGAPPVDEGL